MALTKIDEVYIYTSSVLQPIETHELNAWFDHSGIPHSKLNYGDESQVKVVLDALNTWWQPDPETGERQPAVSEFPLLVYTEILSDTDYQPRKYIQGKENILNNIESLYSIGR